MIVLRKMNNEKFLVNHNQIECIELIPECKIVMMNHDYYIVPRYRGGNYSKDCGLQRQGAGHSQRDLRN